MSQIRKTYFFPHCIGRNTQKTVSSVYKKPPRARKREEDNQIYYFYVLRVTLNSGLLHGANQAHGEPVAAVGAVLRIQIATVEDHAVGDFHTRRVGR